jgi:starch synthase (maltosyl-transferring)
MAAAAQGRSIEDWIGLLNRLRRRHPALHTVRTLRFHPVSDDALIAYSKTDPATGDTVLCVVTLDPHQVRSGELTLTGFGAALADTKLVDAVTGQVLAAADRLRITIDPAHAVAAIYSIVIQPQETP